jgi:hypothetical protein
MGHEKLEEFRTKWDNKYRCMWERVGNAIGQDLVCFGNIQVK